MKWLWSIHKNMIKSIMKVVNLNKIRDWTDVLNRCLVTIGKDESTTEPSDSWKAKMCLALHSPLRLIEFDWKWEKIPYNISVHFLRHVIGNNPDVEPFIQTQRSDRTGKSRQHVRQTKLINMAYCCNAESLLTISNKRLCKCADIQAQKAWRMVIAEIEKIDPIIASKCVPSCIAKGYCVEFFSPCGYDKTAKFQEDLKAYRNVEYTNKNN